MAISLQKGQKVSLRKTNDTLGEILINLNWNRSVKEQKGFFNKLFKKDKIITDIDLDLGCLYELKNGKKGSVQALGNKFGSYNKPPFVILDGDDRTGDVKGGENLRINGDKVADIKRILVYTFIYNGIANWQEADATVTIKYPGAEDLLVKMDTFDTSNKMCGLVLFENLNDLSFTVTKLVKFYEDHRALDRDHNWGLGWIHGSK